MIGMMDRLNLMSCVGLAFVLSGCPGDDTTDDGGNGESTTSIGGDSTDDDGGTTNTMMTTGSASGGQDSSGGSSGMAESGSAGSEDSGDSSGSDGDSTDTGGTAGTGGDEQTLCTDTGGTWDETACGHYECGVPNACEAIIPGCDCGETSTFVDGMGCVVDDACAGDFGCGDELQCSLAGQYCEVFFPGVKGADIMYTCREIPKACAASPDCQCLEDNDVFPALAGSCMGSAAVGLTVDIFAP